MIAAEFKDVYVCVDCGRTVTGVKKAPEKCPRCGGKIVKKVVVE